MKDFGEVRKEGYCMMSVKEKELQQKMLGRELVVAEKFSIYEGVIEIEKNAAYKFLVKGDIDGYKKHINEYVDFIGERMRYFFEMVELKNTSNGVFEKYAVLFENAILNVVNKERGVKLEEKLKTLKFCIDMMNAPEIYHVDGIRVVKHNLDILSKHNN